VAPVANRGPPSSRVAMQCTSSHVGTHTHWRGRGWDAAGSMMRWWRRRCRRQTGCLLWTCPAEENNGAVPSRGLLDVVVGAKGLRYSQPLPHKKSHFSPAGHPRERFLLTATAGHTHALGTVARLAKALRQSANAPSPPALELGHCKPKFWRATPRTRRAAFAWMGRHGGLT
jgi:hypothetical protein